MLGPAGHGWTENDDPPPGATLHGRKGAEVASAFDVAHAAGLRTGLFAGKTKFSLYEASYGAPRGPARRSLDEFAFRAAMAEVTGDVLRALREQPRCLLLAHYADADLAGHAAGWDLTPGSRYLRALAQVDAELGRILDEIEASPRLRGRIALVVTTDHGGGAPLRGHGQVHLWINYVVPFLVWSGDEAARGDLYELNPGRRREPGLSRPRPDDPLPPPVRNGDAGNLALDLLGLPPIPGSTLNAAQDLRVRP